MLASLTIRNVVLIETLTLAFERGLCVLTGETGAGKSILLDALGLALGARSEAGLVRRGADQASVSAEFLVGADHPVLAILREQGLALPGEPPSGPPPSRPPLSRPPVRGQREHDDGESLVLRRTVSAEGRSRAFVNDQPVGVALLRRIGEELVEVHGQFETYGLLDPRTHQGVLDAHAGLAAELAAVTAAWRDWRQTEQARARAAAEIERARAEEEYLRHAVGELETLAVLPGEEATLAEQRAMAMHREKVMEAVSAALGELGGDRGAGRGLAAAMRGLGRIVDKAGGRLDGAMAALDRASAEVEEAVDALEACARDMDHDAKGLERMEERLFALRAAARKYSTTVDELPALCTELAERLALIEDQGDTLNRLAVQAASARERYLAGARRLSETRRAAAGRLDQAVAQELAPLRLNRSRFVTEISAMKDADWGPSGIDRVAFRVSTNPGAPPGALDKIASGGELARFMLALKVVLAQSGTVPTLIFDEVDTGIGGAVAAAVGDRLARLGREVQVLVVTHSPQVAARGASHYTVRKTTLDERVVTDVGRLDDSARVEEIARMLSGAEITAEARAAAQALLNGRT